MNRKWKSGMALVVTILSISVLFAGCHSMADQPEETTTSETLTPEGETKKYSYQNFEFELTNVKADRAETMTDDGGNAWTYTIITYYPGATLTVIQADMSDPAYSADGKAYAEWAILLDPADPTKRINSVDDMQPLTITSDMAGIFDPESSLYIFRFEPYAE